MKHRRSQSIVKDKSFRFPVQIVEYIHRQQKDHVNLVLSRQLLRSGTSIRASVEEALRGQSSQEFYFQARNRCERGSRRLATG